MACEAARNEGLDFKSHAGIVTYRNMDPRLEGIRGKSKVDPGLVIFTIFVTRSSTPSLVQATNTAANSPRPSVKGPRNNLSIPIPMATT